MLMHDKELAALLSQVKTVAVIGAVDKPGRPVNMVGHALISMGYTVIPIHPKRRGVWGLTTYPSINDVPIPIDVVDLFRSSDFCPDHAREVLEMRSLPSLFWMQSGVYSPKAREILSATDITVVEDRCLKVELERLGIHR